MTCEADGANDRLPPGPDNALALTSAGSHAALSLALWRLLGLQGVMNASHFMAMPLLAVYCTSALGLSAATTGAVLAVYFAAARMTPVVVAPLVDRFGRWPAVSWGLFLRGVGFFGLLLAPGETAALLATLVLGLGTALTEAGAYGVIGAQPQATRERLIVFNAQALNVGCVLGPLTGAGLAAVDLMLPLLASGVLFVGLALAALFERSPELTTHTPQPMSESYSAVLGDRAYLLLCVVLVPWWALFAQLFAAFPLEATARGGSPGWAGSVLVVNGGIGFLVLFAVPALMRAFGTIGLLAVAIATGGVAIGLVGQVPGLVLLLLLVAIFSAAEIAVLAGAEILVGRHAGGRAVSTYFALFNMSWGLGGALGGAAGPLMAQAADPKAAWALMGATALVSLAGLALYRRVAPVGIIREGTIGAAPQQDDQRSKRTSTGEAPCGG
jgi:Na+/melibiose symporter-like transporter